MKILSSLESIYLENFTASCVTLGKFDGIHKGHQKLFEIMRDEAEEGEALVAFTFDCSIRSVLSGASLKNLFSAAEKRELMKEQGIDILVECPFTDEIRTMEPESFVAEFLVKRLRAKKIIIGDDFHFGYNRMGDGVLLEKLSNSYGYQFYKIEKEKDSEGLEIASTRIRKSLSEGNIEKVNDLLGFPYFIEERVVRGNQLGAKLESPTINQKIDATKLLPPFGVYFSKVIIDEREFFAVTNIGCKPTVSDEKEPVAETYIFNFDENIYDRKVKTCLYHFLREERIFSGIRELKEHIKEDMKSAYKYWGL